MSPGRNTLLRTAIALIALAWLVGVGVSLRGTWNSLPALDGLEDRAAERSTVDTVVGNGASPGNTDAVDIGAGDDSARVADGTAAAPASASAQRREIPSARYRMTFNGMLIEEVERGETYSYIESGIAVDSMLISRLESLAYAGDIVSFERLLSHGGAIVELGCLRDFDYYFVVGESGKSGFHVYFTNDERTPIRELLGDRYSANSQKQFDADGYRRAYHVGIPGTETCVGRLGSERP